MYNVNVVDPSGKDVTSKNNLCARASFRKVSLHENVAKTGRKWTYASFTINVVMSWSFLENRLYTVTQTEWKREGQMHSERDKQRESE